MNSSCCDKVFVLMVDLAGLLRDSDGGVLVMVTCCINNLPTSDVAADAVHVVGTEVQ